MIEDMDAALARLARNGCPAALDRLDAGVFARIDAGPAPVATLRVGLTAAAGAVAIGLGSTALVPAPALAAPLIDSGTALAPSTLLSGLLR